MIYSKWHPEGGGYDYYETSERFALSDDLPKPDLPLGTAIGVASTEIGRELPSMASYVGHGKLAVGMVTPLDRSGLSGVMPSMGTLVWLGLGFAIGWLAQRRWG